MALQGFPNDIKVMLGPSWSGKNGLDPYDVLILSKVSGLDVWTPEGTDAPSATNNLRFIPTAAGGTYALISMQAGTTSPSTFWVDVGSQQFQNTGISYDYYFGDVWTSYVGTQWTDYSASWSAGVAAGFLTSYYYSITTLDMYSRGVFTVLQAAAPGDLNVLEGATPIPDGLTTPRDFGSVFVGGVEPTKTFTVQNLGDISINISNVTVPSGYTITQGLPVSINGGNESDLIIRLNTNTAGTFFGDIVIESDDVGSPMYNWAVTGTILVVEVPKMSGWGGKGPWGRHESLGRSR